MEKIRVFNRRDAGLFEPKISHAWISISTPGDDPPVLNYSKRYSIGLLRIQFHDLDDAEAGGIDAEGNPYRAPDELDARQIYHFVNMYHLGIQELYVHCDAGISRSAGVAAALSKIYFDNDDEFFGGIYRPNRKIYRHILEVHEKATNASTGSL